MDTRIGGTRIVDMLAGEQLAADMLKGHRQRAIG